MSTDPEDTSQVGRTVHGRVGLQDDLTRFSSLVERKRYPIIQQLAEQGPPSPSDFEEESDGISGHVLAGSHDGRPSDSGTIGSIHDVLSCPRRRVVVHLLQEADRPLSIDELADRATDLDVPPTVVKHHRPDQPVRSWLYHEHVLELDAADIVAYDPETDRVRLGDDVTFSVHLPE